MLLHVHRATALLAASAIVLGTAECGTFPDIPAKKYVAAPTSEAPVETPWLVERGPGREQPGVSFSERGDVRMRVDGDDVLVRFTKTATYWLAPAPTGDSFQWRIDDCALDWTTAEPVPDTGTY